jgi:hypothetical protein
MTKAPFRLDEPGERNKGNLAPTLTGALQDPYVIKAGLRVDAGDSGASISLA